MFVVRSKNKTEKRPCCAAKACLTHVFRMSSFIYWRVIHKDLFFTTEIGGTDYIMLNGILALSCIFYKSNRADFSNKVIKSQCPVIILVLPEWGSFQVEP